MKILFNEHFDSKEKQSILKFFPYTRYFSKAQVCSKSDEPFVLFVLKGELVVKYPGEIANKTPLKLLTNDIFNGEGFLLNYNPFTNVYCLSEEAIVLKINRREFENVMDPICMQKIASFLFRSEINANKYEILTEEKRREK